MKNKIAAAVKWAWKTPSVGRVAVLLGVTASELFALGSGATLAVTALWLWHPS